MPGKPNSTKVAILGSRGIPARYGGFETFVERLAAGLPKDRFQLYVFCERSLKRYGVVIGGVRAIYFPVSERFRIISEVFYDIVALFWAAFSDVDIVYLLGYTASIFCVVPRLFGKIVLVNVDGLEWKRRKFPFMVRVLLRLAEAMTTRTASYIVCDSMVIQNYYLRTYQFRRSFYAPYSALVLTGTDVSPIGKFGLEKGGYYLTIARLEPENNVDLIIRGFKCSKSKKRLAIVGPVKSTAFGRELMRLADERVIFLGGIYEKGLVQALRVGCFAYIHGHEVGGTSPTLLETLGSGSLVLSLDTPSNREVARDAALYFGKDVERLGALIRNVEGGRSNLEVLREHARSIVQRYYSEQIVIDAYVRIFSLVMKARRWRLRETTYPWATSG